MTSQRRTAAGFGLHEPLGLALAGGGAHGAWQAGCLDALTRAGLRFGKVLGFSAGALSGSAYVQGLIPELLQRWGEIDRQRILRFTPRLGPLSLFSLDSLREAASSSRDEERAKRRTRVEFTVVGYCVEERRSVYWRFTPEGQAGWDGPLAERLVASCAIPLIFPPVRIGGRSFRDGCLPGQEGMRFDALAGCRDVIVVQMCRPEEAGRTSWNPWLRYDQEGRDLLLRQLASGIESLRALPEPPRVWRLMPSRVLDFSMISFRGRVCAPALALGAADAAAFLEKRRSAASASLA